MASSYSTSLKIQLMANGEDSGTWGTITNTNWNLIEQAVSGVVNITMTNANYTLSNLNGISDEARNAVLVVGGTNSGIYQVIAPLVDKVFTVVNNTVGGYAITIGGSSGSLVTIPNGKSLMVYCDGTNFYAGPNYIANAATATTATTANSVANSGGWSVTPSGTKLYFNYNGTNVGSLDSSGNFIALGNVTAYGTP